MGKKLQIDLVFSLRERERVPKLKDETKIKTIFILGTNNNLLNESGHMTELTGN